MEQRPQPSEQSWKKGQARCVLIPVAPHSSLDKAARLPEIPAGRFGQLGNLSRLPADLLPQLFKDGFSQSLVISGEGKKYPWAEQPNSLGTCPGGLRWALLVSVVSARSRFQTLSRHQPLQHAGTAPAAGHPTWECFPGCVGISCSSLRA